MKAASSVFLANDISQLAAPAWNGPGRGEIRGENV